MIALTQKTSMEKLSVEKLTMERISMRKIPMEMLMGETGLSKLEVLREKINNEDYLHEAIQRIALIISNELLDLPSGGRPYEQQRKSRSWPRK